jgi:predicted XRE-type DNA-binding protein
MKNKAKKGNFDYAFPPEKILAPIRARLSDPAYEGGSQALPANASTTDRLKFEICKAFVTYLQEKKLLQKELAKTLGIDEPRMSDILKYKIDRFTLDRLIEFAEVVYPHLEIELHAQV